jgi:hypothetical protein
MGEIDKKPSPTGDTGPNKKRWDNHKTSRKRFGNTSKPVAVRTEKFHGGKDELDGNHFDCTGYGQSDRFVKTVQKIADYVNQEYKNAGVTRTEIITQTETVIPTPARPVGRVTRDATGLETVHPPDVMDISDYQNQKKISDYQIQNQIENRQKVFSLVWQQCTESMHAKIKAHRDYQAIEQALNGIELLRVIKLISFNIEDEKYIPQKVHETKAAFYALKQGKDSDQAYQIKFLNTVQVIEQCGASLGEDPMTRAMVCKHLAYRPTTTSLTEIKEITDGVRDYTLGAALILGADPVRYGGMIRNLKNASLAGRDEWPKNVTEAYNYLSKWEGDEPHNRSSRDYEGNSFVNDSPREKDKEPKEWHKKMTCRNCNQVGHIAAFCENNKAKVGDTNVQDAVVHEEAEAQLLDGEHENYYANLFLSSDQEHRSVSFQMKDGINGGRIPKDWILLDSQSTTDAFSNPKLLRNIHEVKGSLTIHTQAGKAVTKMRGTVPGYGEVWYCPDGIANILSLAQVAKTREVIFDSTNGNQFVVTKDDGSKRVFRQSQHGLYYYDMQQARN